MTTHDWGQLRASVRDELDTLDNCDQELALLGEEDADLVRDCLVAVSTVLEIALDKCADTARANGLA